MDSNRAGWVALLSAVAILAVAATGVAVGQDRVTVTVTVVDDQGETVSDVDVSATWNDGAGGPVNGTTRANGQVLVDVPEGANVTFRIADDRYVRNVPYVLRDAQGGSTEITVARAGSATITAVNGSGPVDDAIVRLIHDGEWVVNRVAGDDGRVTATDVEQGSYDLVVYKAGYLRNESTLRIDGDVSRTVSISQGSRTLSVSAVDDHFEDPRPVNGATVTVQRAGTSETVGTVSAVSDGTATIGVPVNDRYEITVTKDGYVENSTVLRVGESDAEVTLAIQRRPQLSIAAANDRIVVGETVRVTVTDEYGDPVSGAAVGVGGSAVAETDDQGQASVEIESAGTRNLTADFGDLQASTAVEGVASGNSGDGDTESASETATETGPSLGVGPGFGPLVGLAALLIVGYMFGRR